MKNIAMLLIVCLSVSAFAQPKIELATTEFDFGQIVTAGTLKKSFIVKNTGTEPLILSRVSTGDGGSYATYPKVPISPDSTGEIIFHYNTKRIGLFRKTIFIKSNAANNSSQFIRVKGEVIHKVTQMDLANDTVDVGVILFGNMAKATFEIKNAGPEKLYLQSLTHYYYESDLFYQRIATRHNQGPIDIGDTAKVTLAIRNIYGNTGDFQRKLLLRYNSLDTVTLVVKGRFVGVPTQDIIYEERKILEYENGQLYKVTQLNYSGDCQNISFHKGGYVNRVQYYSWKTGEVELERIFDLGVLIEERRFDNKKAR
jgi:hypothetical protein